MLATATRELVLGCIADDFTGATDLANVLVRDLEFVDLVAGRISLIDHDPRVMGRQAAELLIERIAGAVDEAKHVVLPTTRVTRAAKRPA